MSTIDYTLDRIRIVFDHLPRYDRPTCHITGTNGKGSVSAILTSIFKSSSPPYRVGRFNSPHLVSVYDCITIDDVPVAPDVYAAARSRVEEANDQCGAGASSFEFLTLTALQIFQDVQVDIAVVEVGMGGRLDATNVIPDDCILVSALTSVVLDHQAALGNTVEAIAREKVGIARAGKPFVLGSPKHAPVTTVVRNVCENVGAPFLEAVVPSIRAWNEAEDGPRKSGRLLTAADFLPPEPQPIQVALPGILGDFHALLPLQGEHQLINLGTALSVISVLISTSSGSPLDFRSRITTQTVRRGIQSTTWSGRLSFHKVPAPVALTSTKQDILVLVDGAHNPASSATLSAYVTGVLSRVLNDSPRTHPGIMSISFILALSHSPPKTPLQTLTPLLPPTLPITTPNGVRLRLNIALVRFTPPEGMPWVKSVPPSDLRSVVSSLCPDAQIWSANDDDAPEGQVDEAVKWATAQQIGSDGTVSEGMIVLAGSLYLVADFYRFLERNSV